MRFTLLWALVLALFAPLAACDSGGEETPTPTPTPTPTTGIVSGSFSLQAGASGSIDNARVALYVSEADYNNDNFLRTTAAAANGSYSFTNVNPGNYYLDVWKDLNNNSTIDSGDLYGVYTTNGAQASPFAVTVGQTTTIGGTVRIIPNARGPRPVIVGPRATSAASE